MSMAGEGALAVMMLAPGGAQVNGSNQHARGLAAASDREEMDGKAATPAERGLVRHRGCSPIAPSLLPAPRESTFRVRPVWRECQHGWPLAHGALGGQSILVFSMSFTR